MFELIIFEILGVLDSR